MERLLRTIIVIIIMIMIIVMVIVIICVLSTSHSRAGDGCHKIPGELAVRHNHHWDAQHLRGLLLLLLLSLLLLLLVSIIVLPQQARQPCYKLCQPDVSQSYCKTVQGLGIIFLSMCCNTGHPVALTAALEQGLLITITDIYTK